MPPMVRLIHVKSNCSCVRSMALCGVAREGKMKIKYVATLLALLLVACGGGDGGESASQNEPPRELWRLVGLS